MLTTAKRHSLILAAYIVATLLMTMPLAWRFTDHIAGQGGDPWQTLWRFTDKATALEGALQNHALWPFIQSEFLGGGEARLVNVTVWPWMPLHYIFGEPIAYNLVFWLSFFLAGYGMYILMRYLFMSYEVPQTTLATSWRLEISAFLAGLLYMFLPFHVAHAMGHFGAMQIQWLPLVIWAFFRWVKKSSLGNTAALAAFFILQAFSEHHYVLWLGIAFCIYAISNFKVLWRALYSTTFSLVIIGLSILFVGLVYWPTVRLATENKSSLVLGSDQTIRFSADLFAFIAPSPFHPLWRWSQVSSTLYTDIFTGNSSEATQFLGIIPLLLIFFFSEQVPQQQKKQWGTLAIVFFIISLGPRLHVLGTLLDIPLPYAIVDSWPVFSAVRAVARAGVMVGLGWSVLFGWVLYTQLNRLGSAVLVAVFIVLEFLFIPLPLQSSNLSNVYAYIKDLPGTALIEIPAATNYTTASQALYASTIHHKNIIADSALERGESEDVSDQIKQTPGVKQLLFVRTTDLAENRDEFFGQDIAETLPDALKWLDVFAIVIHTDSVSKEQLSLMRDFLEQNVGLEAQKFDDNILLYQLNVNTISDGVFVMRGQGWDQIIFDTDKKITTAAFSTTANVKIVNVTDQPQDVQFTWSVDDTAPNDVVAKYNNTSVTSGHSFAVPPGESTLQFINTHPGTFILKNPEFQTVTH